MGSNHSIAKRNTVQPSDNLADNQNSNNNTNNKTTSAATVGQMKQQRINTKPKSKSKSLFNIRRQSIDTLLSISRSKSKNSNSRLRRQEQLIVEIMMPLYFTEETLLSQDVNEAKASWDMIVNDQSQHFNAIKSSLPFHSCREYFEHVFYDRLFDIHPFCKKMFSNPSSQGKFLTALFSFIFTVVDDEAKFNDRLIELAKSHTSMGVKSTEYAVVGSTLFWSARTCLGAAYTVKVHEAWVKLFSKMLSVIVPVSVSFELVNNDKQKQRVHAFFYGVVNQSGRTEGESGCPVAYNPPRPSLYQLPRSFQIRFRWMWSHDNQRLEAYTAPQTDSDKPSSSCPMAFSASNQKGKRKRRMLPYLVRWMAKDPLDEKTDWVKQSLKVIESDPMLSSRKCGRAKPIDYPVIR